MEEKKPLRFLFKREKPAPRPETPVVDEPPHVQPYLLTYACTRTYTHSHFVLSRAIVLLRVRWLSG